MLIVAACAGSGPSTAPTATPIAEPSQSASASPSASTAAPAIVGEWVADQDCERIVAMLRDAGLEEFVAEQVYEFVPDVANPEELDPSQPCEGAVQRAHSHFFTADGRFGSKDFHGQQVDDGTYRLEGDDVVIIGDQRFRYSIDGDELTLEPPTVDISGCTTRECRFTATWVLMVAMPGTPWKRGEIPVS